MQIGAMGRATANKIAESLYAQDTKKLQDGIGEYFEKSISFYDAGAETYHGLVLGLVAEGKEIPGDDHGIKMG